VPTKHQGGGDSHYQRAQIAHALHRAEQGHRGACARVPAQREKQRNHCDYERLARTYNAVSSGDTPRAKLAEEVMAPASPSRCRVHNADIVPDVGSQSIVRHELLRNCVASS